MYGITNQNVWVLQIKCMIITNQNVWALQIKCMVTTNQNVWSIQMKCMVITSQMYSHYKSSCIQFLTLGGSHDCLYKPSKYPFLVGHMTCLHKPSKFPFLVFLYMISHMIITTHLVPPYPRFLPNWETLLNQVTGSFPPTEWLIIQEKDFPPLWWIKKPRDNFLII